MSDFRSSAYWKNYQASLQREKKKKKGKKIIAVSLFILFIGLAVYFFQKAFHDTSVEKPKEKPKTESISKSDISKILKEKKDFEITKKFFTHNINGKYITFETTINKNLQNYLQSEINLAMSKGNGAPELISFAVLDPDSGRILGLKTGYKTDEMKNAYPSTQKIYPAASIFKIVTAAASVETMGYTPNKRLWFNGGKYTLYKRQLRAKKNKYTNNIRFKDAFAQSVNPVFGKIGYKELKKEKLSSYAEKFLFNKDIFEDINVKNSDFIIDDTPYTWAELACGFNHTTEISPLHGAVINSIIINKGKLVKPYLIKKAMDDAQTLRYENKGGEIIPVIKEPTASAVFTLMERTIKAGTAKSSFNSYRRGRTMKNIVIGGKTGSIFNREHTIKYDWFTGFAKDKKTGRKISFAILVGHGKYLGEKAATYGRRLIANYYGNL